MEIGLRYDCEREARLSKDNFDNFEIDNKDYDLRVLLNGETLNVYTSFTVNEDLKDGKYDLAIAIVDENGNPDVRLAQVGNYDSKITIP